MSSKAPLPTDTDVPVILTQSTINKTRVISVKSPEVRHLEAQVTSRYESLVQLQSLRGDFLTLGQHEVSVNPFIRAFEEQRESQEAPHLTHLTTIRLRLQILAVLGHEMSDEEDVLAITDSDPLPFENIKARALNNQVRLDERLSAHQAASLGIPPKILVGNRDDLPQRKPSDLGRAASHSSTSGKLSNHSQSPIAGASRPGVVCAGLSTASAPKKRYKWKPSKSSTTPRNLCALAWHNRNPDGDAQEFSAYWDTIKGTPEAEPFEEASRAAEQPNST